MAVSISTAKEVSGAARDHACHKRISLQDKCANLWDSIKKRSNVTLK
jgi:hypothetical protein